jgi:hypothetical protein
MWSCGNYLKHAEGSLGKGPFVSKEEDENRGPGRHLSSCTCANNSYLWIFVLSKKKKAKLNLKPKYFLCFRHSELAILALAVKSISHSHDQ